MKRVFALLFILLLAACSARRAAKWEKPQPEEYNHNGKVAVLSCGFSNLDKGKLKPLVYADSASYKDSPLLTIYTYDSMANPESGFGAELCAGFLGRGQYRMRIWGCGSADDLLQQLIKEGKHPRADVVLGLDQTHLKRAMEANLLQSYKPQAAPQIRPDLIFDQEYNLIPFEYADLALIYDNRRITNPITSWQQLAASPAGTRVAMGDPLKNNIGTRFLYATGANPDQAPALWQQLNAHLLITPTSEQAQVKFVQGDADYLLSYNTLTAFYKYNNQDIYSAVLPADGGFRQVECVGILKNTPDLDLAKKFVEYLYETRTQWRLQQGQFMYAATTLPEIPHSYEGLPQNPNQVPVTDIYTQKYEDQLRKAWQKNTKK